MENKELEADLYAHKKAQRIVWDLYKDDDRMQNWMGFAISIWEVNNPKKMEEFRQEYYQN